MYLAEEVAFLDDAELAEIDGFELVTVADASRRSTGCVPADNSDEIKNSSGASRLRRRIREVVSKRNHRT